MRQWENSINQLRQEIDEMKVTFGQNGNAAESVRQSVEHAKKLCESLEQQLSTIEVVHRKLRSLADKLAPQSNDKPTADPSPSAHPQPVNTKVLVVDDIPVNNQLLLFQLKSLGLDTDQAANGLEAIEMCQKQRYALVFMDCDMPVMNGVEATERIRQDEKTTGAHLPIVAMTSYDREGDREACLASGMDEYLCKGVKKTRLREIVDRYVFGKTNEPCVSENEAPAKDATPEAENIDLERLRERFKDEADEIVSSFFGSAETIINCLEFAIDDKDAVEVNHFAFTLKGPCATLGLSWMVKLCVSLSSDAEAGRWPEVGDQYKSLQAVFQKLKSQAASGADSSVAASHA